jgi:transposase
MAQKRLSVRKTREILRLHFEEGRSLRGIGSSVGVSPSVVHDCLARFKVTGLEWPLGSELDDVELERRMYVARGQGAGRRLVAPDCESIHRELSRKGVTLYLLWQEYKLDHGEAGYQYSQFCEVYRKWRKPLGAVMRQRHKAGDKAFVDWSGDGIDITDRATGEVREAPLFVAALGASGHAFAKAAASRKSVHWLRLHSEMMEHWGGVTAAVVPDNEKTGVTSPCRYDPDLNPVYAAWAEHYGTTVMPARPGKPRDKAMVENAVLNAQRWILAALRNHVFFSVEQANQAIAGKLVEYNERPLQKRGISRRELFEQLDRPALRALPLRRFEPFEWSRPSVNIDYHVVVDKHHYSAPYTLIGERLEARWTGRVVELFHKGRRVASHARSYVPWGWTTADEHRPPGHQAHLEWTPERIIRWASKAGPGTAKLAEQILAARSHPERGYRACLGVMRLGKKYGEGRLEAACARAVALASPSYRTVRSILDSGADRLPLPGTGPTEPQQPCLPHHENIRGPKYYH